MGTHGILLKKNENQVPQTPPHLCCQSISHEQPAARISSDAVRLENDHAINWYGSGIINSAALNDTLRPRFGLSQEQSKKIAHRGWDEESHNMTYHASPPPVFSMKKTSNDAFSVLLRAPRLSFYWLTIHWIRKQACSYAPQNVSGRFPLRLFSISHFWYLTLLIKHPSHVRSLTKEKPWAQSVW